MKPTIPDRLIIFDGVCNLCNGTVQFIIKRDREKRFRFVPLQSLMGEEILSGLGLSATDLSTVVYVRNGIPYVKSTAVLRILKDLGWRWNLIYGLIVIPKCIRNGIYDIVARKRYRWFGRQESCMVPSEEILDRFL
ncbi:thiol-disulfide oxidoreductase DCC family protein [Bacteroidota bacterium]